MIVEQRRFGARVRALRSQKGLTLTTVAKLTKRSVSLLSQIETGRVSPSFASMRIIADALGVPLSRLILDHEADEAKDSSLMGVRERKVLTTQGGVQHQLLSRSLALSFEFLSIEIPPGASTGEKPYTHDGVECGLLLEGEIEIQVDVWETGSGCGFVGIQPLHQLLDLYARPERLIVANDGVRIHALDRLDVSLHLLGYFLGRPVAGVGPVIDVPKGKGFVERNVPHGRAEPLELIYNLQPLFRAKKALNAAPAFVRGHQRTRLKPQRYPSPV